MDHQESGDRRAAQKSAPPIDTLPEALEFRPPDFVHVLLTDTQQRPVVVAADLAEMGSSLAEALACLDGGQPAAATRALQRARHILHDQLPPAIPPLEAFQIDTAEP